MFTAGRTILLLLITSMTTSLAFIINTECKQCDTSLCPTSSNDCPSLSTVSDPCGCCPDGICPAQETESCQHTIPCDNGYFCDKEENDIGAEGVCRCRRDKRAVCANDNITYTSICDMERASHKPTFLKWGHCDRAPEIVSGSDDIEVIAGQPMALDCEVKGSPIPSVMWYFTGKDGTKKMLPSDDHVTAVLVRGGPEHMMVTSWMQIVEARRSDQGLYTCVASNEHGLARHEAVVTMINYS